MSDAKTAELAQTAMYELQQKFPVNSEIYCWFFTPLFRGDVAGMREDYLAMKETLEIYISMEILLDTEKKLGI